MGLLSRCGCDDRAVWPACRARPVRPSQSCVLISCLWSPAVCRVPLVNRMERVALRGEGTGLQQGWCGRKEGGKNDRGASANWLQPGVGGRLAVS